FTPDSGITSTLLMVHSSETSRTEYLPVTELCKPVTLSCSLSGVPSLLASPLFGTPSSSAGDNVNFQTELSPLPDTPLRPRYMSLFSLIYAERTVCDGLSLSSPICSIVGPISRHSGD